MKSQHQCDTCEIENISNQSIPNNFWTSCLWIQRLFLLIKGFEQYNQSNISWCLYVWQNINNSFSSDEKIMSSRQHYLSNANVNNIFEKLRMHFKIGWWANFFYAHTFVIMMMIFSACKFLGLLLKISEDDAPLPKHEYTVMNG